jgi:hypothetical protein
MSENTLFESMWNQELLGNYERMRGADDDKPQGRSIADAIADIHRATLSALIEVSRPPLPAAALPPAETYPVMPPYAYTPYGRPPYAHRAFRRHPDDLLVACIHPNCPMCHEVAETEEAPPRRPRRCTVCGSTIAPHSGIFYNDANGIMCRACAAARGDVPPARQPAPTAVADAHANDGVLADDHDSMLDEPEVATPGLGALGGADVASVDLGSLGDANVSKGEVWAPAKDGNCFHCGQPALGDEYCFGCKAHICHACDGFAGKMLADHGPRDHLSR